MNSAYKKAMKEFDSGLYCAESVLKVITKEEGIHSDLFPGIATGFCSGMARTNNMCGAITGGIMALNIIFGRQSPKEPVESSYTAVQELISLFEKEFGTSNCQELLGINLGAKNGTQQFIDKKLHKKCRECTGKAAQFTRFIIDRRSKK